MPSLVLGYYHVSTSISPLLLELESLASGISVKVFGLSALCDHLVRHIIFSVYKNSGYIDTVAAAS